jgi:peptidoglycan/LPS O-acetylase OafA/YrhL
MPELDVVRGIAVLMVVHCHLLAAYPEAAFGGGGISGHAMRFLKASASQLGWLGVQLFFVLSGFLITGILVESRRRRNYYARFYARRSVRILPAYLGVLCLLVLLGGHSIGLDPWGVGEIACALLFAANLMSLFGLDNPYGPLWSLAVEEHFYLVWPTVARRWTEFLARICLLTGAVALVGRGAAAWWGVGDLSVQTWFNLDGLLLGAFLAVKIRTARGRLANVSRLRSQLLALGVVGLLALASIGGLRRATFAGATFAPLAWSLLFGGVLLTAMLNRERITRQGARRVLVGFLTWIGFLSYGLYLIHTLLMHVCDHVLGGWIYPSDLALHGPTEVVKRYLVVLLVSIGAAWLSRVTYEEYFLRRKEGAERFLSRVFASRESPEGLAESKR